jgi:hypothetical protein
MDGHWKSAVGGLFTIWTPDQSTVGGCTAFETRRGLSTWVHWIQAVPAKPTTTEDILTSFHTCLRASAASMIALGIGFAVLPTAWADDEAVDPGSPGPIQVAVAPQSDDATAPAVAACQTFGQVLDGASNYYGSFADSFEGSDYSDPAVQSSNEVGRTALRQAAGTAMDASNVPGLQPEIAGPMRSWSLGATALLVKMGLRIPGDSLNNTATSMNNNAEQVQEACATAGTHA